jgi:hypothetical protein
MAEEPRKPQKMTTKQLTYAVNSLEQAFNHIAAAIGNDMQQVMAILGGLLRHFDLLWDIKCPSCGVDLSHPNLDGVPKPDKCPACNSSLELNEEE